MSPDSRRPGAFRSSGILYRRKMRPPFRALLGSPGASTERLCSEMQNTQWACSQLVAMPSVSGVTQKRV
jgi:hypothetical protein